MFSGCENLKYLDISNFNTKNVEFMDGMFKNCKSLKSLNLNNFDISNVYNLYAVFYNCQNLISLNLSNFIPKKNISSTSEMFYNCKSLELINLSNFDFSKVFNTEKMFEGCNANVIIKNKTLKNDAINNKKIVQSSYKFEFSSLIFIIFITICISYIRRNKIRNNNEIVEEYFNLE